MSSSTLEVDNFPDRFEEDVICEQEYGGVTASWLRKAITTLSKVAGLHAHKKFKAAVKIQSYFRGWTVRKMILLLRRSAVIIQKTWRGFLGRARYFLILEKTLQSRMMIHYNRSATVIQATFRGFYSRKYIHDHFKLVGLQLRATNDLLKCVALQTRELKKNQKLPGVYSLRNSRCLSKVEKLLASLKIKKFNEDVRRHRIAEMVKLSKAFDALKRSQDKTMIPFGTCVRKFDEDSL